MLLQLDTDPELGLQWGDMGVAYFAVPARDLRRKDFARAWCLTRS